MRIRRRSMVVLGAFVVTALAFGTIAAARGQRAPMTQSLRGTYTLSPVEITTRTCAGTDGVYLEARGALVGTSRSADPRFNGKFEVLIDRGLINLTTGRGTSRGNVVWWDASGRKATFDSHLNAAAEFGGAGDSQTPAVVQSGGCGADEEDDD